MSLNVKKSSRAPGSIPANGLLSPPPRSDYVNLKLEARVEAKKLQEA